MAQTFDEIFSQMTISLKCPVEMPRAIPQDCWRKVQESKRVDFVSQFPFEVASTILQGLCTADLFEAMKVSRGWRQRIMNSPNLWHEITVADNQYELIPKLSTIGKHIRKYVIYDGGAKVVDGSLNMMFYGSMRNVRSLSEFTGTAVVYFLL
ncbi:hypothetical protein BJV82DRAFT_244154 [Fennellomyces sp. T-0311]|nr:hypothetical protein BJV82DRAFT_244154 [Fennellomyces sp. T-0311]